MDNTWITVKEQSQIQKTGDDGRTVAFLAAIHSVNKPSTLHAGNSVGEILKYLFENETAGEKYFVRICPNLNWTVVQKSSTPAGRAFDDAWDKTDSNTKFLLIDEEITDIYGLEKVALINGHKSESNLKILEYKYSKNNGEWGYFSAEKKRFVKRIFSKRPNINR